MSLLRFAAAAAAASVAIPASVPAQPATPPAQLLVTVWSYGFAPHPIHLAAGRPVTLTFTNRSGNSHDFTAGDFFHAAQIISGPGATGEIELKPHETKTVTLVPRAAYTVPISRPI